MNKPMKNNRGFTLTELTISFAVLSVITLLGYIVISTSLDASRLTDAQAQLQGELRDVMQQISSEARSAYTAKLAPADGSNKDVPAGTDEITVAANGRSVTFQRPVAGTSAIPVPSTPITLALQCEDVGFATGNAKLDSGEDANGNGILDRRVNRTQDGATTQLGASNDVCEAQFQLVASQDTGDKDPNNAVYKTTLLVRLVASKVVGAKQRLLTASLESRIHLEN